MLSTLATGLDYPGGADQAVNGSGQLTGPLYVPRFGDIEDASARRLPRYDIRQIVYGGKHGVDVVNGGTRTLRSRPFRHDGGVLVAIDGSGNYYVLHKGERTLTRISAPIGGGNEARTITRLAGDFSANTIVGTPTWMAVDAGENVYVSLEDQNKVLRFVKASGYAMGEIAGFKAPWGMAFSDTTPQAMFVSNTEDGVIRRVTNPLTATVPDAGFAIAAGTTVKGLAYMATGTVGTGTLFMANGSSVKHASITGNAYAAGTLGDYVTDLPTSWSYLYARSSTKELFGYGSSTWAHKISAPPDKIVSEFANFTGNSIQNGFALLPDFSRVSWTTYGISGISAMFTTREVELNGSHLYVASPDTFSSHGVVPGGIMRIDLTTNGELYVPLRSYSLGLEASTGNLYVGAADNQIYRVTPQGLHTAVWNLGTLPYGLDVRGSTVWAVGANGRIYQQVIGNPAITSLKYGFWEPGF
jgi:hypothetical protein